MFTVKVKRNGATHIVELSHITVANVGSLQWDDAHALAQDLGCRSPDVIECFWLHDPDAPDELNEAFNMVERSGYTGEAIAILCIDEPCSIAPELILDDGANRSCAYVFLYQGDEAYILDEYGNTIEVVA